MNKIIIQLPINRDYAGRLEIQNAAGKRIAGPFPVCGRADDERAQANKNPARNPLLPFGDTPLGEYKVVKIIGSGQGTPYSGDEFGSMGLVLLQPKQGDAALADANGRFGFFIQGGAWSRNRLLRPTQDGSLRLSDGDQRRFIGALRKLGETNCQCLVISTAKAGGKVAIASSPASARTSRNKSSSLLLASSVVASLVTGTIRQALLRTALHGAGASIASSGLVLLAQDNASAQNMGDYTPTGSGQETIAPPSGDNTVDLHDKQGIVDPNAASGNMPPASAAGLAPGSPIFSAPQPSSAPEETPPAPNATPESQLGDQNVQEQTVPPPQSPSETQPENNDGGQPHLKDSLPGTYLNDTSGNGNNNPAGIPGLPGIYVNGPRSESDATGPSDTTLRPLDQIDRGVKAPEETGPSDAGQPNNSSPSVEAPSPSTPGSLANPASPDSGTAPESQNNPGVATPLENPDQPAPAEQSPAEKAMVEHDSQNLANPNAEPSQSPGQSPENSGLKDALKDTQTAPTGNPNPNGALSQLQQAAGAGNQGVPEVNNPPTTDTKTILGLLNTPEASPSPGTLNGQQEAGHNVVGAPFDGNAASVTPAQLPQVATPPATPIVTPEQFNYLMNNNPNVQAGAQQLNAAQTSLENAKQEAAKAMAANSNPQSQAVIDANSAVANAQTWVNYKKQILTTTVLKALPALPVGLSAPAPASGSPGAAGGKDATGGTK
jgi:hypothetical protein